MFPVHTVMTLNLRSMAPIVARSAPTLARLLTHHNPTLWITPVANHGPARLVTMTNLTSPFEYLATQIADDVSPVTELWRNLTAEGTPTGRELWLTVLVDGEPTPVLIPIEDIPAEPEPEGIAGLVHMCGHFVDDLAATSFAFLLVRPSIGGPSDADRRWALALLDAARAANIPLEPIHHANAVRVEPFRSDDFAGMG